MSGVGPWEENGARLSADANAAGSVAGPCRIKTEPSMLMPTKPSEMRRPASLPIIAAGMDNKEAVDSSSGMAVIGKGQYSSVATSKATAPAFCAWNNCVTKEHSPGWKTH